MKTIFLIFVTVFYSQINIAKADYDYANAPCGYTAVLTCVDAVYGYDVAIYFSVTSQLVNGTCLNKDQVNRGLLDYLFSSEYPNARLCKSRSDYNISNPVKIFVTNNAGAMNSSNYREELEEQDRLDSKYKWHHGENLEFSMSDFLGIPSSPIKKESSKIVKRSSTNKSPQGSTRVLGEKFEDGIYSGQILNGKRNGVGTLRLKNQTRVTGTWENDILVGNVNVAKANGDIYFGEYSNFIFNGKGTLINKNGNKYVGKWKDGKRNGNGIQTFSDSNKIQNGVWFEDVFAEAINESKVIPEVAEVQDIVQLILPTNNESESKCDIYQNVFSGCIYGTSVAGNLEESLGLADRIRNKNIDVNFLTIENGEGFDLKPAFYSSILETIIDSGRYSIDRTDFPRPKDLDELTKVVIGRYTLYDNDKRPCDDDSCMDQVDFELSMVNKAASQCSFELILLLRQKGFKMNVESDDYYINPIESARLKREDFKPHTIQYSACTNVIDFLELIKS